MITLFTYDSYEFVLSNGNNKTITNKSVTFNFAFKF